ncbi:MAG: pyridoxamine 5'-phosphate oxidase family protein [bacterium]|nr:pyridoxamine 5'-phosphate oxidase family protein [bacterium]
MRRKDKEITGRREINAILHEARVCRVGFCLGREPYIVPMNFGYDGSCLYLHSASEGKKMDMLRKNKNVCFETDIRTRVVRSVRPCNWRMRYLSVIGYGRASVMTDPAKKKKALECIIRKYPRTGKFSFSKEALKKVSVIKVDISPLTGKRSGY